MIKRLILTIAFIYTPVMAFASTVLDYRFSASFVSSNTFSSGFDETTDDDANVVEAMGTLTGTIHFDNTVTSTDAIYSRLGAPTISIDGLTLKGTSLDPFRTLLGAELTGHFIATQSTSINSVGVGTYTAINTSFLDETVTYFSGGLVFPDLIELSDFSRALLSVRTTHYNGDALNSPTKVSVFEIDSLTPVPLPGALPLLVAAVGTFGVLRRRKTKRVSP